MRGPVLALLIVGTALPSLAQERERERVIDLRAARPQAGNTFEALWAAYRKAAQGGDNDTASRILDEIRRLRIERNIRSLETVALAVVGGGIDSLRKGDLGRAESQFRTAVVLDPHLPDAHYGLALTAWRRGPLGVLETGRETVLGLFARAPTARGGFYARVLLIPTMLLALLATVAILAATLLLRHGTLLLHEVEEVLGAQRPRSVAVAVAIAVLLLPVLAFQGYAWLPLWWLAVLFLYFGGKERAVTVALLLAGVAVGPAVKSLEAWVRTELNPVYRAGIQAVEMGPDARAILDLEGATRAHPEDRDLVYLLAVQYKKAGRYDDAATLYREILRTSPDDPYALNNLANLEFARGEFQAAIARYQQAASTASGTRARATCFYNVSLAHLQRFEYQPAQEARARAAALDAGLIEEYDQLWRYDRGDYAVVDLGLTGEQVRAKFAGLTEGLREKNVAALDLEPPGLPQLLRDTRTRLTGFAALFLVAHLALRLWRGSKTYAIRCAKCGTPFCSRCHLGAVQGGLCTQCYHLFVVRDGVSGPARNQKLLEVQRQETRQARVFRVLSLLLPGAGQVYLGKTLTGAFLLSVWCVVLAFLALGGRVLPVTETSASLATPWTWAVAGLVLLGLYVAANRRPQPALIIPVGRLAQRQAS